MTSRNAEAQDNTPLNVEKAFFALWLWLTTNNSFFQITSNGGQTVVNPWITGDDLTSLKNALSPLGIADQEFDKFIATLRTSLETGDTIPHNVTVPDATGGPGTVVRATVNRGEVLLMAKELYVQIGLLQTSYDGLAYPVGDPSCRDVKTIYSIVPQSKNEGVLEESKIEAEGKNDTLRRINSE